LDSTCQDPKPPDPTSKVSPEKSTSSAQKDEKQTSIAGLDISPSRIPLPMEKRTRDEYSSSSSDSISTPVVSKRPATDAATQTATRKEGISVATATDEVLDLFPPPPIQNFNDPTKQYQCQSDTSQEIQDALTKNNWPLASILMHLQRCESNFHLLCTLALIVNHLKQDDPHLEELKTKSMITMNSLRTQAANIRSKCPRQILKRPSFEHQTSEANEHQRIADVKAITGEFYGKPSENFKSIWITLYHIGSTENFKEHHFISALLSIFKGLPLEQLQDLLEAEKSFEEILSFLEHVYVTPEPASRLQKSVDLLYRHKEERINAFIARSSLQIDLTRQTYQDMSRHCLASP
jgi:hypothetical protein